MLRLKSLRQTLKLGKMSRGVSVTKSMICNQIQTLTQQISKLNKLGFHKDLSINSAAARRGFG